MRTSTATRPSGCIPGSRDRDEPLCWTWDPPDAAQWEYARREDADGTPSDHEAAFTLLVRWCRYRCAICGRSDMSDPLVMDHDHSTWRCRGVLCRTCNRVEGFGGGPLFSRYRERNPASICGVSVWYQQSMLAKASPEIVDLHIALRLYSASGDWRPRQGRPWILPEERIASRSDLTDEEVAGILGRTPRGVAVRRRTLELDLPDINGWW
jgi:hypothetical protein